VIDLDIVLLYRRDCPNVLQARASLEAALAELDLPPAWCELDLDADDVPAAWRRFGSPTVLVSGEDVATGGAAGGASCRVYDGLARAPSAALIAGAIRGGTPRSASRSHGAGGEER
jgi:hypothetical protein